MSRTSLGITTAFLLALMATQGTGADKRPSIFDDEPSSPKAGLPATAPSASVNAPVLPGSRASQPDAGGTFRSKPPAERSAYEANLKRAEAVYRSRIAEASATYTRAMQQTLEIAKKAGDLDEALAAQAQIKAVDSSTIGLNHGRWLNIDKVIWSGEGRMQDVTMAVRAKAEKTLISDAFDPSPRLEDIAPYKTKTLSIRGSYGGREFYLSVRESPWDEGGVWFGKSPPPGIAKLFAQSDAEGLHKAPRAQDARIIYQSDLRRAEVEYQTTSAKAARTYVDALKHRLASATGSDDASVLRAELAAIEPDTVASDSLGLTVEQAVYSMEEKAVDATARVRAKVKADVLIDPFNVEPRLADLAPNRNKVLTIHGHYSGREFWLSVHERVYSDGGLWLGKTPPPSVAGHFTSAIKAP